MSDHNNHTFAGAEDFKISEDDSFTTNVEQSRRQEALLRRWAMMRAVETTIVQLRAAIESVAFVTGNKGSGAAGALLPVQPELVAAFLQAMATNHAAVLTRGDCNHVGCNDAVELPLEFVEKMVKGFQPGKAG